MRIILLVILVFLSFSTVFAQDTEVIEQDKFEQLKVDRLKRIRLEIIDLDKEIKNLESNLKNESEVIGKIRSETRLKNALREKEIKRLEFIETATNVSLDHHEVNKEANKTFSDQLKELFDPIFKTIRQASERPRKIQEYKEKLELLIERNENATIAVKRLEDWKKKNKDKTLAYTIKKSIQTAQELVEETRIKKEDIEFKLQKIARQKGSLVTEVSNIILGFFKTKGKNLFLALISFMFSYWIFKRLRGKIINLAMFRLNRNSPTGQTHWLARPLRVLYSVFTWILSMFFSLLTLYILNDFVLVTFIIFVFAALIWSSKEYLPVFFEQSKMILNLGPIREGERIIFQGLPWQVKSLGFFTRLENPTLAGGTLRVNTRELLSYYSRPSNTQEPWFPTKSGDWVELSDGTYGKVIMQTPEQVAIKLLGSEVRYMTSSEFFAQRPTNLSDGFSVEFLFGVDYQHQSILFTEVIPTFKKEITDALFEEYTSEKDEFKELTLEFKQAGASSLDLRFFMRCTGKLASRKRALNRKVNSLFVEVCNRHGYVIPFNQLTVHMQK